MGSLTTNYELEKPDKMSDKYDIDVHNRNSDKIDAELKKRQDEAAAAQDTADEADTKANGALGEIGDEATEGTLKARIKALEDKIDPVGVTKMYFGTTDPAGWMICDGRAVSRTGTTAALFALIGVSHGPGDGINTFNIPDFRGIFPKGAGMQGTYFGSDNSLYDGGDVGTQKRDQFQGHGHAIYGIAGQGLNPGNADQVSSPVSLLSNLSVKEAVTDGVNGTPRVGAITEPASVSLNYIIKY